MGHIIPAQDFALPSDWSFKADLRDDAGLVLNKVRHASNSFATDMRVVKVYVFPGEPDKFGVYQTSSYVLGRNECPSVDKQMTLSVPSNVSLIRPYNPAQRLSATFEALPATKGGQKITFKQIYLFTDYNKSPTHEPGGIVEAARIYPLFRFEYRGVPGEKNPPESIRVDYRFDISLDGSTSDSFGASPNQVGVFTDDDGFNVKIGSIFQRGYKPLPVEMIGNGLASGKPTFATWDNIHQWGKGARLPLTPGAANAAHSHWRWGAIAAGPLGASHFKGLGGAGGPMLDPAIPEQSLDFAITGRRGQPPDVPSWDPGRTPSTQHFEDLFVNGRSEPADIKDGATLTQWWSLMATRSPESAQQQPDWNGTFFVHGFFFAHGWDAQLPLAFQLAAIAGGLGDPLEKPPLTKISRKRWVKP